MTASGEVTSEASHFVCGRQQAKAPTFACDPEIEEQKLELSLTTISSMTSPVERLQKIVVQLRSPNGCPWDREQTHQSLKPHLVEECYELIDAIDAGNDKELKEELGDLLLQVVLHSQMAAEASRFTLDEVATAIADKLVNRHPHVFGESRLPNSEAVLRQ